MPPRKVVEALKPLGFEPDGRHFVHPDAKFIIEFPTGPLMVGDQRVARVSERMTPAGKLRLLSPADCVKDRLAAFFHWNDRQSLEQACLVATVHKIDLTEVRQWSRSEGREDRYRQFESALRKNRSGTSKRRGKSKRRNRGRAAGGR